MITWNMMTSHYGEIQDHYTAAVTLLDLIFYFLLTVNVSRARGHYKVDGPATDGPPGFRRVYRVHMNTLEQLVLHFPLLWLTALSVGDRLAAILGIIWLLGRVLYVQEYTKDPKSRVPGFVATTLPNFVLFIACVWGVAGSF